MKASFLILVCLLTSVPALAAEPSLRLSIGEPTRVPAPPGYPVPGSEWVRFSVRATNLSAQSLWLRGFSPTAPFYRLFTRPMAAGTWTDYRIHFFGSDIKVHPLAPDAMVTFFVAVPAWYTGQQLRIEMDTFATGQTLASIVATSEAVTIKQPAVPNHPLQPTAGALGVSAELKLDLRPGGD